MVSICSHAVYTLYLTLVWNCSGIFFFFFFFVSLQVKTRQRSEVKLTKKFGRLITGAITKVIEGGRISSNYESTGFRLTEICAVQRPENTPF